MNLPASSKFLASLTLAAAGLAAAPMAEARPDVYVSIGFQSGPAWVEQAPVYVQPQPVYVQPAPVYVRPPVFVRPPYVYEPPCRDRYDDRREWRRTEWHRHERYDGYRREHDHGHHWDRRY
ncbi:MAG TPA: hypothetical protein VFL86_16150 [Burkholderiaceae bacterium]|nr:hypothetical protein [Burkholderiaceae bacterium]